MPETTLSVDGLIYNLAGWSREAGGDGTDLVAVDLAVEHPAASLGDARTPPPVELRDAEGGVHEIESERGWSMPLQPDTAIDAHLGFRVPETASGLDFVIRPANDAEVVVRLDETY